MLYNLSNWQSLNKTLSTASLPLLSSPPLSLSVTNTHIISEAALYSTPLYLPDTCNCYCFKVTMLALNLQIHHGTFLSPRPNSKCKTGAEGPVVLSEISHSVQGKCVESIFKFTYQGTTILLLIHVWTGSREMKRCRKFKSSGIDTETLKIDAADFSEMSVTTSAYHVTWQETRLLFMAGG